MLLLLQTSPIRKSSWRSAVLGFVLALAGIMANVASAQTMEGLGYLPGAVVPSSTATGVLADGSKVVGYSYSNVLGRSEAFAWTATTGMVGLGFLPSGAAYLHSQANGLSADGSTVVGESFNAQGTSEAFVLKLTLDPAELMVELFHKVVNLKLNHGIENSLVAKLHTALAALNVAHARNDKAAINSLNAFINEVKAQRGKAIPMARADALIAAASKIIALLH